MLENVNQVLKQAQDPVKAIQYLESIATPYAIGRDIHVGDTIVGIKGRVGFEAAAAILILKGHHLLEKHTLSKFQLNLKSQLADWYGSWLHEGLFLDPAMRDIEVFFENTSVKSNFLCNLGYADETALFQRLPRFDFPDVCEII